MSEILKTFKRLPVIEKLFLGFLIISQIYYFFRYTFSYGSTFAPPNYQLTPSYLQYGKYGIALVFLVIISIYILKKFSITEIVKLLAKQKIWLLICIFIVYTGISLLKFGINPSSFGISQTIKMLFVIPFVLLIPFVWNQQKPFESLKIFLTISFAYHLLFEAIAVLAFFLFHRLPGLAFSNLLPRYGGGWDDPNGFAAFCLLLILVLMVIKSPEKFKGKVVLYLLLFLTVLSFFLAYSVTGFIGLVGGLFILLLCRKLDVTRLAVLLFAALIFFSVHYATGYLHLLYEAKVASSVDHLAVNTTQNGIVPAPPTTIDKGLETSIGSFNQPRFHENIYLQTFFNYGLFGLLLLMLIEILTIYRAFVGWLFTPKSDYENKTFFLVAFIFLGAFMVINAGIPLFQVFPINLFAWVVMGLVWTLTITGYDNVKNSFTTNLGLIINKFIKGT